MEIEVKETVTRKIKVYPRIKCGSENIKIYNCGYSSFNCAGGECKRCGHTVETNANWDVTESSLIKAWNKENDPSVLIERLDKERLKIVDEIKRLKKLRNKMSKLTKD